MFPRQFAIIVPALLAAGCQGIGMPTLPSIAPYRIDIQQGNLVTQDMVAKLQPGMTRSQVRYVLGTPLVTDIFHPDRWDYVYSMEKGGKVIERRRIAAVFSGDKLLRIEGDVVASAAEKKPAPTASANEKPAAAPTPSPSANEKPAPAPAASTAGAEKPVATPAPAAEAKPGATPAENK